MTLQQGGQRVWRAAVIVLLASMGAACGGDDDPDSAAVSEQQESSADPTTDETPAPSTTSTTAGAEEGAAPDASAVPTTGDDGGADQPGESDPASLVGPWARVDGAACGAGYPLTIEFREIDYLVELDPARAPVIDSGGYELVDATTIRMTRPNDAMVTLTLRLGDGELTLTDEAGCVVDYRRA